jgi:hypothetical protein
MSVVVENGVMVFEDGALMQTVDINLLLQGLHAFHAECPKVFKSEWNKQLSSYYADLATILDTISPFLVKSGLVLTQAAFGNNLATTLYHTSGQWMRVTTKFEVLDAVRYRTGDKGEIDVRGVTPQTYGSALTYARRYAVGSILSLTIDSDDDGNGGQGDDPRRRYSGNSPGRTMNQNSAPKAGSAKPADANPKIEVPKADVAPAKIEPLSNAKISEIVTRIGESTLEKMPACEAALTRYGSSSSITKALWGDLIDVLLGRWISLESVDGVEALRAKVTAYGGRSLLPNETVVRLIGAIDERIAVNQEPQEKVEGSSDGQ